MPEIRALFVPAHGISDVVGECEGSVENREVIITSTNQTKSKDGTLSHINIVIMG
jgi:hypothetical protein